MSDQVTVGSVICYSIVLFHKIIGALPFDAPSLLCSGLINVQWHFCFLVVMSAVKSAFFASRPREGRERKLCAPLIYGIALLRTARKSQQMASEVARVEKALQRGRGWLLYDR